MPYLFAECRRYQKPMLRNAGLLRGPTVEVRAALSILVCAAQLLVIHSFGGRWKGISEREAVWLYTPKSTEAREARGTM